MKLGLFVVLTCILAAAFSLKEAAQDGSHGSSDGYVFVDDMKMTAMERQSYFGKPLKALTSKTWPDGTIFYEIGHALAQEHFVKVMIEHAMAHWKQRTCLEFKKRTTEPNFIKFTLGSSCWSRVGFHPGAQEISAARTCWTYGSFVHLLGHALGFLHEENRPDRDAWIKFHPENLKDGEKIADVFPKIRGAAFLDWMSFGTPYDYYSCMHSRVDTHSKNGQVTLTPTLPKVPLGAVGDSYYGPSLLDFQQTNLLYKCPGDSGSYRNVICQYRSSSLYCYGGRKIKIVHANYGRKRFSLCGIGFNVYCGNASSFKKVQELCDGKTTCALEASNEVFGNPCRFNLKYLEVVWQCHP